MSTLLSDVLRIMSLAACGEAILAYCATTWDKDLEVHEDVEPDNPPEFSGAPQAHVCSGDRGRSKGQVDMGHVVYLGVFADPGRPTALDGYPVTYFPGRAKLEGLARLVERAVSEALLDASIPFDQVPVDPDRVWGRSGMGVFYAYQINFHDPLYT
jgi:hypothetical protein